MTKSPDQPPMPTDPSSLWDILLNTLKKQKSIISAPLSQSDYSLENNRLTIYAKKSFYKMQLEKHKPAITELLPENLEVIIISEQKPSLDPNISMIADIMGGGEEVEIND